MDAFGLIPMKSSKWSKRNAWHDAHCHEFFPFTLWLNSIEVYAWCSSLLIEYKYIMLIFYHGIQHTLLAFVIPKQMDVFGLIPIRTRHDPNTMLGMMPILTISFPFTLWLKSIEMFTWCSSMLILIISITFHRIQVNNVVLLSWACEMLTTW